MLLSTLIQLNTDVVAPNQNFARRSVEWYVSLLATLAILDRYTALAFRKLHIAQMQGDQFARSITTTRCSINIQ